MKLKLFKSLFLILFVSGISFAQDESFKELFNQSRTFLIAEEFEEALPILMKMDKLKPHNSNTMSSIGYCLLKTTYRKKEAIPYFEEILKDYKNLTPYYDATNSKLKKAPVEVLQWAGQAYHYDYQFDEAIEKYKEYKDLIDPNNTETMDKINRDIRLTRNAQSLKKHPVAINLVKLNALNTEHSEYRPKINGDESIMYFTSRRPNTDGSTFEDIFISEKVNNEWSTPVRLDDDVNSASHDACLYISPDGQYMIIYRTSLEENNEGGIYETSLNGNTWSEPKLMTADLNSDYWETDAFVSADGKTLYYTSDKPGGVGGRDLWIMKKLPTGEWAKVQNIGNVLNTEYDEQAPFLHPDGKTLYFSSKGHNTMGGFDVFKSEMQEDGSWSAPINIGYPINTTGDDVFYYPTNNGKSAYFSSFREGGSGEQDLYMIELPGADMKTLAVYKGLAKYTNDDIITDLDIIIFDSQKIEKGNYKPNSTTGKFLFILQPGETYTVDYELKDLKLTDTIEVPSKGGVYNILKIITIIDGKLMLIDAELKDGKLVPLNKDEDVYANESEILNNFHFMYDKDVLEASSKNEVDKIIDYLNNNPKAKIVIENNNDYLSSRLKDANIDESRILSLEDGKVAPYLASSATDTPNDVNDFHFLYSKNILDDNSKSELDNVIAYLKENPKAKIIYEEYPGEDSEEAAKRMVEMNDKLKEAGISGSRILFIKDNKIEGTLEDLVAQGTNISGLNDTQVADHLESGGKLVFDKLYFIYDYAILVDKSVPDIAKITKYMKANPKAKILLSGHTDSKGDEDYNKNLSLQRSERVKKLLYRSGIAKYRIKTIGLGESQPVTNNTKYDGTDNPEGRQLNRRVEITIE